tara:strand:+ start:431 stop:565 length:135 start_codon:yes stop_codon:yes gene_type:complete
VTSEVSKSRKPYNINIYGVLEMENLKSPSLDKTISEKVGSSSKI